MKHLLLLILLGGSMAVIKSDFKTCEQSGFCNRNRYLSQFSAKSTQEGLRFDLRYRAHSGSLKPIPGGVNLSLEAFSDSAPFLNTSAVLYSNGALQVVCEEIEPKHPRYRIPPNDVADLSQLGRVNPISVDNQKVEWVLGNTQYLLYLEEFKVEVYISGKIILTVNERSLMNFERYRPKDYKPFDLESLDPSVPIQIRDTAELLVKQEDSYKFFEDLWEEKFNGFTDQKKKGPSSVAMDFTFHESTHLYGLSEHADALPLKNTVSKEPYRLFNLDVFEYEIDSRMALYGAVPYVMSRTPSGQSAGVFWANPSETWVDVDSERTHWISESGTMEFFVLAGSPLEVTQKYTMLTGPPVLPPLFSLGYHQCRWNYNDQEDLMNVAKSFEHYELPVDVFWLDIEHTPERQYFMWDKQKFPSPMEMQDYLSMTQRKLVTIVDPHLKRNENYYVHKLAQTGGKSWISGLLEDASYYVKNEQGEDYDGHCWPGSSSWPDFTRPEVRDFWASQFSYSKYQDSTPVLHIWNDMNEPAVFNGPEKTMPKGNMHGEFEHRDVHNIYGMYMHRSTFEGLIKRSNHERPFVLSRSFFAGTQKYGAIWTGDNAAKWEYLYYSVPMCLSLSVSGISFCGADVGGFFGDPSPELLVRWYQLGAYIPFFRGHAHIETKRREPYLFPEPHFSRIQEALRQRYSLIPYLYTLFYEYSTQGTPVMRPLFLEYPEDNNSPQVDRSFHLGPALLVTGIYSPEDTEVSIYLPNGRWFNYHTYEEVTQGNLPVEQDRIPVLLRGGSILPKQERVRRSTKAMTRDPYTLVVACDVSGAANGTLFLDDGETFRYKAGNYLYSTLELNEGTLKNNVVNKWKAENEVEKIEVVGLGYTPSRVQVKTTDKKYNVGFYEYSNYIAVKLPRVRVNEHWEIQFLK